MNEENSSNSHCNQDQAKYIWVAVIVFLLTFIFTAFKIKGAEEHLENINQQFTKIIPAITCLKPRHIDPDSGNCIL